jgi:CRP-like cAMP-binding protein
MLGQGCDSIRTDQTLTDRDGRRLNVLATIIAVAIVSLKRDLSAMLADESKSKSLRRHGNRLLAQIPVEDYERLRPHLKPVPLDYRAVLYKPQKAIEFVHFIESGVGSLVHVMKNGSAAEVGTIGNEGIVGLPVVFGARAALSGVYMQVPGAGLRMSARIFNEQMNLSEPLRKSILRYANAFFNKVAQSAACAYFHPLEMRCCRWLMMTRDRMPSDEFLLTQEFLAMMLGVRRPSVSTTMASLQRKGLLRYNRGNVTVLDRKGLQAAACECYKATKAEFDLLLGAPD